MRRVRLEQVKQATLAALLASCPSSCGTSSPPAAPRESDAAAAPLPDASLPRPPQTANDDDAGLLDAAPPEASQDAAARCIDKDRALRNTTWTLTFGGDTRSFDVHVPPAYDPTVPMPLVMNFHGFTSDAPQEAQLSDMNDKADSAGFIVAYPQGWGKTQSWNAGLCCGDAVKDGKDDVGLAGAMLDMLEDRLCVDRARIYATGMSNGAFFSHRLGCEMSTRFAAIAPVAGVLGVPTCAPSRPVPVLEVHGTLDPLVPYGGGSPLGFPSVHDTFTGWAQRDGCTGDPVETYRKNDAHCDTYRGCRGGAEVTLCTIDGGGHTWPGGLPVPSLGYTSPNLNATDAMWDFFERHPLR